LFQCGATFGTFGLAPAGVQLGQPAGLLLVSSLEQFCCLAAPLNRTNNNYLAANVLQSNPAELT